MQNNNGVGPGGHPACASCKHQRKRCGEDCMLAPYFPANRNREFQAIHKVFGVSNVTKLVKNVKEEQRNMLVDSLIWEAMSREKDPVLGPLGDYRRLQDELAYCIKQNQSLHNALSQLQHQHPRGVLWNATNLMSSNMISNNNSVASNGFGGVRGGGLSNNSSRDMINYDDIIIRDAAIGDVKPFSYPTNYMQSQEKVKENSVISMLVPRQQHQNNSFPGFNHQHQHHNPAASASTSPAVQSFR
ncbi:hypothetical protein K2173_013081 [Erythroxylum novogranatense]|uniref:LOB domain-containing protein n=1 Tax=Erythroxylum novogranatense TaxID=1862640 RepID=A0AAV8S5S2_9ROSI|nr:hypothetical protein K2173_013081 [Erythroxylum novogranatense]